MNQCLGRLLLYFKITLDLVKNNDMIVVEIENQDFSYKSILNIGLEQALVK